MPLESLCNFLQLWFELFQKSFWLDCEIIEKHFSNKPAFPFELFSELDSVAIRCISLFDLCLKKNSFSLGPLAFAMSLFAFISDLHEMPENSQEMYLSSLRELSAKIMVI